MNLLWLRSLSIWVQTKTDNASGAASCRAMWKLTEEPWTYDPIYKEISCEHMRASLVDCAKGKVWMVQRHDYAKLVWTVENTGGIDTEAQV